ncbi:MAG: TIGR01777 family protein [Verrucomicrobia bacterium]|nr:TIGR01777 family protein [Verrucomicrobiota bacterium]
MKILITGSTGLVGRAATAELTRAGHEVWRLMRQSPDSPRDLVWDPAAGKIPTAQLEGFEAVLHLAGENLAGGRWTAAKKQRIRDSRVLGTQLLAESLAQLHRPPKIFLSASAIGIYGNRDDELLTEASEVADDFLARVCREWETATQPAERAGMRVVHLRFGIILSPRGGAMAKMLPLFRLGLGGVAGGGAQYWSWVSLDDAVGVIQHALFTESLRGPVNVVAPEPVTNREFTKTLGRVLHRPTIFPAPAFALRLAFGEMADPTVLASAQVQPERLLETRYEFRHPQLEPALHELLE